MRFFRAWLFVVRNRTHQEPQETRNGGKGVDIECKAAMGSGEEATAATEFQKNLRADQLPGFVASRFNDYELS
jgi:hypothetical protein